MIFVVFLLLSTLFTFSVDSTSTCTSQSDRDTDVIVDCVDGDILIGYVIDKKINQNYTVVQNLLSFQAAVTEKTFWPKNATVGYTVFYFPAIPEESYLDRLMKMLNKCPKIVALMGLKSSESVLHSASLVSSIKMPTFTWASGIIIDELLTVKNNDFMTRITSTRTRQVTDTIPSILSSLGVNIVSVFYDEKKEAEFTKLIQVFDLGKTRVDVEYHLLLNGTADSYHVGNHILDNISDSKSEKRRFRTVVLLLRGAILEELLHNLSMVKGLSDVIFVTDSSGCRTTQRFTNAVEALANNSLYVFRLCQTRFDAPEVLNYIEGYKLYTRKNGQIEQSSKVLDSWYREELGLTPCVTGEDADCKSVGQISLHGSTSRYNHRIYYAVRKLLKSLENISNEQVNEISERKFKDILIKSSSVGDMARKGFLENKVPLPEDTTFLRYANGTMVDDYEILLDSKGKFGNKETVWNSGENNKRFDKFMKEVKVEILAGTNDNRHFACSTACTEGNKTVLDRTFLNCWTCVPCSGNTYTENGSWASCKPCQSHTAFLWVNDNKTACDRPAGSVDISTDSGRAIWTIASFNIVILFFTIVIYVRYWKSRVIISSGRDLSSIMFAGILIGHILSMLIAMEPSSKLCILIQIFSHLFMMLTVCPLLVKTFRIWLVFKFSIKLGRKLRNYVNNWVTISECLALMIPQSLLLILGFILESSYNYRFTINYTEESLEAPILITKSCGPLNFTLMLVSIVYTGVQLLVASALGWDCRKLPDNFKESMHIFLSSLISLLLVAVYVPAMLTMAGFTQVSLLAGVITVISVTLNLVIFMPKVYVVLFVPPIKQKQMFKSTVRKSTVSETMPTEMGEME